MAHTHIDGQPGHVTVAPGPRNALLVLLALVAVATILGLHVLWPAHAKVANAASKAQFAAPGVTFPKAQITQITKGCRNGKGLEQSDPALPSDVGACDRAQVKVLTGASAGRTGQVQLQGPMASSGLTPGDRVELMSIPVPHEAAPDGSAPDGTALSPDSVDPGSMAPDATTGPMDSVFGIDRNRSLAGLAILFVVLVLAIARHRGFFALVALLFSGFMLIKFVLPALVAGGPGFAIALVGSSAIMFVVLYLAHGPSMRTSTALAGTLCGIAITAGIAHYAVASTHLSGFSDETSGMLSATTGTIDFRGLLTCAIIIAGLGVLNDVTITQASAVWELRAAGPAASRRRVFTSAMRIGRDHIASTIYTIVFAYAGAAMSVLLLLYLYDRPALELLTQEDIATEVVRTLCSAIGLVIAVPITTGIAAYLAGPHATPGGGRGGHRSRATFDNDPVFAEFWGERR